MLEGVLYDQILLHLNKYGVLTPHQSGFRFGYSTQDVLYTACNRYVDRWLRAIDDTMTVNILELCSWI